MFIFISALPSVSMQDTNRTHRNTEHKTATPFMDFAVTDNHCEHYPGCEDTTKVTYTSDVGSSFSDSNSSFGGDCSGGSSSY
jgi:hypothetical protein